MTQHEQQLADLLKRQENERTALAREQDIGAIVATVPDLDTIKRHIHIYRLWDRCGSIRFDFEQYSSLRDKGRRDVTLADLAPLAEMFPPIPCAIFKHGCTSIRTLTDANAADEAMTKRGGSATVTPIAPVYVHVRPAEFSRIMEIEWIGLTPIGPFEVSCRFPLYGPEARAMGSLDLTVKRYNDGEIREIVRNTFRVEFNLGDCKTGLIRFSAGSHKTPGDHLVYFEVVDGDTDAPTAQPADLARVLQARIDAATVKA